MNILSELGNKDSNGRNQKNTKNSCSLTGYMKISANYFVWPKKEILKKLKEDEKEDESYRPRTDQGPTVSPGLRGTEMTFLEKYK